MAEQVKIYIDAVYSMADHMWKRKKLRTHLKNVFNQG